MHLILLNMVCIINAHHIPLHSVYNSRRDMIIFDHSEPRWSSKIDFLVALNFIDGPLSIEQFDGGKKPCVQELPYACL